MNTTPETSPEFGVYRISKDYINHLRRADPRVTDPEKTTTYCGPVYRAETKRGPVDYFVPIDVDMYTSQKFFLTVFLEGIFAEIMDFKRMIPCLPSEYKWDSSRENLVKFCKGNEKQLHSCAKQMYEACHK